MTINDALEHFITIGKKYNVELIEDDWYAYTKGVLIQLSADRIPIFRLNKEISKLKSDYDDISKPYVRGEQFGGDGGGSPKNSFKKCFETNIHIERCKIEEEIAKATIERRLLEGQMQNTIDCFKKIVYTFKRTAMAEAMLMFYIDRKSCNEISTLLGYPSKSIRQYIWLGTKEFSEKLKCRHSVVTQRPKNVVL